MAYIPPDAEWYLAYIVLEMRPSGAERSRVWLNTHLVRADSPDEAYTKAIELGLKQENTYMNAEGGTVECRFLGLNNLQVIWGTLEDGVEIDYDEYDGLTDQEVEGFVTERNNLAVFAPTELERDLQYLPIELSGSG